MEYKDFKKAILISFVAVGIIVLWAYIVEDRPECVIEGCHHKQMPHSMVCFSHREMETQPSTSNVRPSSVKKTDRTRQHKEEYSGSNKKSTGKTYSTGSSSHSGTGMGSSGKKQSAGGNPYEAYDSGYDDVFLDGDYDDDRYYNDSDYADGVDDALEDYEDDWE